MRALRRFTARFVLAALATAWLCGVAGAEGTAEDAAIEVDTAEVRLDGWRLFAVAGTTSRPAAERAEAIAQRIAEAAADPAVDSSRLAIQPADLGLEVRAGSRLLMMVTTVDAQLEGVPQAVVAETHRQQIGRAIDRYRAERSPEHLWRGVGVSVAATAALAAALTLLAWLLNRLEAALERRYGSLAGTLHEKVGDAMRVSSLLRAMHRSVSTARIVLAALLVLVWLDVVLAQFPWTRWLSDNLAALLFGPLGTIAVGIADYLPNLLFLIVLAVVTRFGLRMTRLYFSALERGTARLPGFEAEWSLATYKIVRAIVLGIALVMAYPYLPGAGSEALQGLSVFAGLLISLGASSSVANVISGYITTFGRVLRVGDFIKVGDVMGKVTQIRLLTIRVRTIRNEEVTIPNSVIMGSNVINYSALSRDGGLVLQTEVGIGYEVPWRQVHALLLEAARRTPDVLPDPPPFVLQRQLGDFAVVYQLNARRAGPDGMIRTYSDLHQNILDVFNEHGVQIMTPAYEGDPETPKVVPKEQWYAPPAVKEGGQT